MDIDWAALAQVFGVSLGATVALVGVFTLGIVGSAPARDGSSAAPARRVGAYACFALCAAAVAYGIYLIAG
ncbi:hypothetical protein [Streptomyces sp. JJ36]|uniref:hypothetical protein n=1 Tax=Streptomyces sp. JJ36 TaxID=2736645 RepID=UPI001F41010A|nr:hypothetical protein [Streptomyces sp. JJ36]MCF6526287.1 hypothetical protein [Streptomyces sp. JJ36]